VLREFADHPSLVALHLAGNDIYGDALPTALLKTVAMFTKLETLNLAKCRLSLNGVNTLIQCIDNDRWTRLQNLYTAALDRRCICCQREEDRERVAKEDETIPEVSARLKALMRRNGEVKEWRQSCPYYYFVLRETMAIHFLCVGSECDQSIDAYHFPRELYLHILVLMQDF
jgi:hypothetical protein